MEIESLHLSDKSNVCDIFGESVSISLCSTTTTSFEQRIDNRKPPSGTGKELIARAVHTAGFRAQKPFMPIDCAATTGSLFGSQLFGRVMGAFTGATHATLGAIRSADRGTVFFDELGEMELDLQVKLLRTLQERVVTPVGSVQSHPVDVRVIAATNRDLYVISDTYSVAEERRSFEAGVKRYLCVPIHPQLLFELFERRVKRPSRYGNSRSGSP